MRVSLLMRCVAGEESRDLRRHLQFVPSVGPLKSDDVSRLQEFLHPANTLLVLTGAGLSTESGIPDYRSVGVGLYARTMRRPVQYQDFVRDPRARQRYWARNFVGWPQFSSFQPNAGHLALSAWERLGRVGYVVTQNVDELHKKAGSQNVVELHGSTHRVVCLSCDMVMPRWDLQDLIIAHNRDWSVSFTEGQEVAPDGDVILTDDAVKNFQVPSCPSCRTGILKPDVIFFGDNVPSKVVDQVFSLVDRSDRLLVLGSSLYVYSGYRFVLRARKLGKKIAIVNIGPTRADELADLKVDARCGDLLPLIKF